MTDEQKAPPPPPEPLRPRPPVSDAIEETLCLDVLAAMTLRCAGKFHTPPPPPPTVSRLLSSAPPERARYVQRGELKMPLVPPPPPPVVPKTLEELVREDLDFWDRKARIGIPRIGLQIDSEFELGDDKENKMHTGTFIFKPRIVSLPPKKNPKREANDRIGDQKQN